jgi:hypothetical protein
MKMNHYNKKKRRKKYKKLWRNTISLNLYNGNFDINLNYVIQKELFNSYGYYYLKKEVEPIFKGFNKKCYSEPQERKSETEDWECEAQTIYHHTSVDEPFVTVDYKAMFEIWLYAKDSY